MKGIPGKGLTALTAIRLSFFLEEIKNRDVTDLEILHASALTDDGRSIYIQMADYEQKDRRYEYLIRKEFSGKEDYVGTMLASALKSKFLLTKEDARALKLALLLDRWIKGKDTPSLERDFESYYGTIATAAGELSWIIDAMALIANALECPRLLQRRLSTLSERLIFGVEEKGLELARLRVKGLGRAGIKRLIQEGIDSVEAVKEAPLELLTQVIPEKTAFTLKEAVGERVKKEEKGEEKEAKTEKKHKNKKTPLKPSDFSCEDRIEIIGDVAGNRSLIKVNDSVIGITNRAFDLLVQLAVTLKKDGQGWVHKEEFEFNNSPSQNVSRPRGELRNHTLKRDGSIIENDRSGSYRLSIPPENVTFNKENLLNHWDAVVRNWAKKL